MAGGKPLTFAVASPKWSNVLPKSRSVRFITVIISLIPSTSGSVDRETEVRVLAVGERGRLS